MALTFTDLFRVPSESVISPFKRIRRIYIHSFCVSFFLTPLFSITFYCFFSSLFLSLSLLSMSLFLALPLSFLKYSERIMVISFCKLKVKQLQIYKCLLTMSLWLMFRSTLYILFLEWVLFEKLALHTNLAFALRIVYFWFSYPDEMFVRWKWHVQS